MKRTAWLVLAAAAFVSYFYRFHPGSPSGEPFFYFLSHPVRYIGYILKYLGSSIVTYQVYAAVFGLLALILLGWSMRFFLGMRRETFIAVLPFLLLGLYAGACAPLTGVGRVGLGTAQATSYRYVTFANLIRQRPFPPSKPQFSG